MKKYRIRNYHESGYFVQERMFFFMWNTSTVGGHLASVKVFSTIGEARKYIDERIERKAKIKEAKYIEYYEN